MCKTVGLVCHILGAKPMLNNSRAMLAINGILMMSLGIIFYLFSEAITKDMFPDVGEEAIRVGSVLRELMAGGVFFIGLLLFIAQGTIRSAAKRLLFGSGIGFLVIEILLIKIILDSFASVPIWTLCLFPVLALLAFFVSTRQFQE